MNQREIGEIRRHTRRDRCNITAIYGCYVNGQKEIISSFKQSVALMTESEAEKYFGVLKRTLSGTIGKNLIDVNFKTEQVVSSPEHSFLMELRKCQLQNDDLRMQLYQKIIDSVTFEDSFVILVGCENYDVPFKSKDGDTQADASTEVYTYLMCAVCPVKQTKTKLQYVSEEKAFHDGGISQVVSAPELGFLFPAFDGRTTNIYNALYYTHSAKVSNQQLVDALFNVKIPKPAYEQKESFKVMLAKSLDKECSMDVVQTVHEELRQCIELHKQSKSPEPLLVSKEQVKTALKSCGVPEQNVAKFSVAFDETFGHEAEIYPKNVIDERRMEITMPDVSIKVNPERSDLIETRVIGGVKYILICADENVEVNGVPIHIHDTEIEA